MSERKHFATPLEALRYHVSGAIERGEGEAIVQMTEQDAREELARIDETTERTVASVYGVLTADIIERRSYLRGLLGIDDS